MGQITKNQNENEHPLNQNRRSTGTRKSEPKKLLWLFASPYENVNEPEWDFKGPDQEARILIGSYYYWIRVQQGIPELCRMANRKDALTIYEVLHHRNLEISEDDIIDAIRLGNGELTVSREYPISDHIKRKLQILYE